MKNKVIILCLVTLFISCGKEEYNGDTVPPGYCNFTMEKAHDFAVFDQYGNDLLDPNTPNSIPHAGIKIFDLIDGKKVEYYHAMLDAPRGFSIRKEIPFDSCYVFSLFGDQLLSNRGKSHYNAVNYIQWREHDTDTVTQEIIRLLNGAMSGRVWVNGREMKADSRYIINITKVVN